MTELLAISGSLRVASTNSRLLRVASQLLPEGVSMRHFAALGELPHFNPDLDYDLLPAEVARFRDEVRRADALVISSPEYAHGVPGTLKNALDWLVAGSEMIGKPVALINASFRAQHAWASLRETLTVMSARVILPASPTIALDSRKHLAEGDLLAEEEVAGALREALDQLVRAIDSPQSEHVPFQH